MLARVFEEHGISTLVVALVREHAEKVKPSRALFVSFPYGYPLGKPNDAEFQHRVLAATFDLLSSSKGPVLVDFPEETGTTDLPQASSITDPVDPIKGDPANEVTALRAFYERWVESQGGRSAVGLSGIPQRRFRGMVRLMQGYARGEEVDMNERSEDVPLAQFIRYCVDDLKAFFLEARMSQRPDVEPPELHTWFWGETATGRMVAAIAEQMKSSGDAALEHIANGIAR